MQVVEWFTKTNANLTSAYGKPIPSLAFVHIPVYAMRAFQVTGADPSSKPWINEERVQQQGYGSKDGYHAQDYPLIQALLNTSGLVATFSGHDHDNDWSEPNNPHRLDDIELTNRTGALNGTTSYRISISPGMESICAMGDIPGMEGMAIGHVGEGRYFWIGD